MSSTAAGGAMFPGLIPHAPKICDRQEPPQRPRCPVWHNSTAGPIDWARPMTKSEHKAWLRQLHEFTTQTKRARGPQGCITHHAFVVIGTLFFLQRPEGTLCPAKSIIAKHAKLSERAVHDILCDLRDRGVIGWQRRCKPGVAFPWVQDCNGYFFKPPTEWRGYRPGAVPPPPAPEVWGARPPLPTAIDQWSELRKQGATAAAQIAALQSDDTHPLALALAKLRGYMAVKLREGNDCRDTYHGFTLKPRNPDNWTPR